MMTVTIAGVVLLLSLSIEVQADTGSQELLKGDKETIKWLVKRVAVLETQGTELRKRLDRQEEQLQSQSLVIKNQEKLLLQQVHEAEELKRLVRTLNQTVQNQGLAITRLKTSNRLLRKSKALYKQQHTNSSNYPKGRVQSDGTTTEIKNTVDSLANSLVDTKPRNSQKAKRLALNDEGSVAFHAVIDTAMIKNIGINQNIVFDTVLENFGGAYHNQHGVFIAPKDGIYIFSVSIASYINSHPEIQANLNKDGTVLARVFAHGEGGREDQGSVTVVTKLNQGNEVWVSIRGPTDDSLLGRRFSTFMGCLINYV